MMTIGPWNREAPQKRWAEDARSENRLWLVMEGGKSKWRPDNPPPHAAAEADPVSPVEQPQIAPDE